MLSDRIDSLSKALASGASELESELEALRSIAGSVENKKISIADIARLGSASFEALLAELAGKKEIELLVQIAGLDLGKEQRKLLNKHLHRLKSKGMAIPEKAGNAKVTFAVKILSEWAMATPAVILDGQQLLYYFLNGTMGSIFWIIRTDPELGILDFKNLRLGEKQARRIAERSAISKEIPIPVVAVGKDHFFWLIDSARNKTRDTRLKMELESAASKIRPAGRGPGLPDHPVFKLSDPEKIRANPGLDYKSDKLIGHPFFKNWAFDDETVKACGVELDQASHSPLQLSESQLLERMESVFEKYARAGLDQGRSRIRFGLLENAYLMELGKETGLAEIALSLALGLEKKDPLPDFFKKIMIRSFPEAWEKMGSRPGSVIISAK